MCVSGITSLISIRTQIVVKCITCNGGCRNNLFLSKAATIKAWRKFRKTSWDTHVTNTKRSPTPTVFRVLTVLSVSVVLFYWPDRGQHKIVAAVKVNLFEQVIDKVERSMRHVNLVSFILATLDINSTIMVFFRESRLPRGNKVVGRTTDLLTASLTKRIVGINASIPAIRLGTKRKRGVKNLLQVELEYSRDAWLI